MGKAVYLTLTLVLLSTISCQTLKHEGEFTAIARSAKNPGLAPANVKALIKSKPNDPASRKTIEFDPAVYLYYEEGDGSLRDLDFAALVQQTAANVFKVRVFGTDSRSIMAGQAVSLGDINGMTPWVTTHVWKILDASDTPTASGEKRFFCVKVAGAAKANRVDSIEIWIEGANSPYAVAFRDQ